MLSFRVFAVDLADLHELVYTDSKALLVSPMHMHCCALSTQRTDGTVMCFYFLLKECCEVQLATLEQLIHAITTSRNSLRDTVETSEVRCVHL